MIWEFLYSIGKQSMSVRARVHSITLICQEYVMFDNNVECYTYIRWHNYVNCYRSVYNKFDTLRYMYKMCISCLNIWRALCKTGSNMGFFQILFFANRRICVEYGCEPGKHFLLACRI